MLAVSLVPQQTHCHYFAHRFLEDNTIALPRGHPGCIDAVKLFGHFVHSWITNSQEALCAQCRTLEATTELSVTGMGPTQPACPLVGWLRRIPRGLAWPALPCPALPCPEAAQTSVSEQHQSFLRPAFRVTRLQGSSEEGGIAPIVHEMLHHVVNEMHR